MTNQTALFQNFLSNIDSMGGWSTDPYMGFSMVFGAVEAMFESSGQRTEYWPDGRLKCAGDDSQYWPNDQLKRAHNGMEFWPNGDIKSF